MLGHGNDDLTITAMNTFIAAALGSAADRGGAITAGRYKRQQACLAGMLCTGSRHRPVALAMANRQQKGIPAERVDRSANYTDGYKMPLGLFVSIGFRRANGILACR